VKAVRVIKGKRQSIEIRDETGQVLAKAGGARAERAHAAVVTIQPPGSRRQPYSVELRSDRAGAVSLRNSHIRDNARVLAHIPELTADDQPTFVVLPVELVAEMKEVSA
jgi:hypothetical protein